MQIINKIVGSKRLINRASVVLALALVFAISPLLAGGAGATGDVQVIPVSGTFATSTTSTLCDGIEDCVVDNFTGTLAGGSNRLITLGFTESNTHINYTDGTRIDTNGYGVFEGEEHGFINVSTEEFHSLSQTTSTDGCGSTLTIHFHGTIDLDSEGLEDAGTYEGVLVKRTCE